MFDRRMDGVLRGFAVLWILFLGRVFWLQTSDAGEARRTVEERLVTSTRLFPRRGSIVDADGRVLARDDLDYDLTADAWGLGATEWECACGRVILTHEADREGGEPSTGPEPAERPPPCRCAESKEKDCWVPTYASDRLALARLVGKTEEEFAADLARIRLLGWTEAGRAAEGRDARLRKSVRRDRLAMARPLLRNVGQEAAMEVYLNPERYPGIHAEAKARRLAAEDLDPATRRILGATGPLLDFEKTARAADLAADGLPAALVDRLPFGKSGIERIFDRELRGSFGREVRQRDIRGRPTSRSTVEPARDGADLRLTLSLDLQKRATDLFAGREGALVAMDPRTGAILAMAGSGDLKDEDPLTAVTGHVPGSVLKTFTALVAEENGLAPAAGEVQCRGKDSKPMSCEHEHGSPGLVEALGDSCNAYFGVTGIRIGVRPFRDYACRLHLDKPFGLGISIESGGTEWTQTTFRCPWERSDLSNLGIGQGRITLSPLQVAALYCVAANGGRPVHPYLVEGRGRAPDAPVFSAATLAVVRRGLEETVLSGTAKDAGLSRFRAAGKTGTAQVKKGTKRWNAWFAGYAPAEDPRIVVVAVLLDCPDYGGHAAAPLVADFLQTWEERTREGDPR